MKSILQITDISNIDSSLVSVEYNIWLMNVVKHIFHHQFTTTQRMLLLNVTVLPTGNKLIIYCPAKSVVGYVPDWKSFPETSSTSMKF